MDFNKFFQSKTFNIIAWAILVLIVILLVFKLGMDIGFRKANFSYKWGENYYRNFAGSAPRFPGNAVQHDDFMDAHGVFGQVIKVDNPALVIKDRNNIEKTVLTDENTTIRDLNQNIKLVDVKADEYVVVIGEPDDKGQIIAKLIRILPPSNPQQQTNLQPFLNK
jgi:hypothetical protein